MRVHCVKIIQKYMIHCGQSPLAECPLKFSVFFYLVHRDSVKIRGRKCRKVPMIAFGGYHSSGTSHNLKSCSSSRRLQGHPALQNKVFKRGERLFSISRPFPGAVCLGSCSLQQFSIQCYDFTKAFLLQQYVATENCILKYQESLSKAFVPTATVTVIVTHDLSYNYFRLSCSLDSQNGS